MCGRIITIIYQKAHVLTNYLKATKSKLQKKQHNHLNQVSQNQRNTTAPPAKIKQLAKQTRDITYIHHNKHHLLSLLNLGTVVHNMSTTQQPKQICKNKKPTPTPIVTHAPLNQNIRSRCITIKPHKNR